MTSRSRLAVPTDSKSHAHTKVDSVPTSSYCDEEQEGMTTITADSTYDTTEETTSSKAKTQDKDATPFPSLVEHQQFNFATGKEIGDRSRWIVLDAEVSKQKEERVFVLSSGLARCCSFC